jgi:hypothetical protein
MRRRGAKNKVAECPVCKYTTRQLTNFERHVVNEHSITPQRLWNIIHGSSGTCACGCGKQTRWLGWHQGYSATIKGHWQTGKTKENDPRVAHRSQIIKSQFTSGKRTQWSKGLTKENDERVAKKGRASSAGLKRWYAETGSPAWSKGLSKETDERPQRTSNGMKDAWARGDHPGWNTGLTQDDDVRIAAVAAGLRLDLDDIRTRIEQPGRWRVLRLSDPYRSTYDNVEVACTTCENTLSRVIERFIYDEQPTCQVCTPTGTSAAERELADFVRSLVEDVMTNERSTICPLELDIFVPSKMFAIEYNGLYWHSQLCVDGRGNDPLYHQRKSNICAMKGIRLMHVFEDEWRDRRHIVESMVRARLDVDMTRIGARKCEVRTVPTSERNAFFDTNHVDGDVKASWAFGLYYDDELVQCMSLRVPRHNVHREHGIIEVARCCPKLNTYVVGGLSRLSRHSLVWVTSAGKKGLMSYVDKRLGGDHAYQDAGWQFSNETKHPRFWWTDANMRYDRFSTRADKTRGMSESDVARERGVGRIYGCRNKVYTLLNVPATK